MNKIEMCDLKSQYRKIEGEINAGIQEVLESGAYVKGPKVKELETALAAWVGAKHCITCGNGTDALQIALMALGLKPGDEVITPTFTFIATAEVAAVLGLTPVVVDVDWETMNMDVNAVKKAITPKTKAIVPVHLFGQCANMEAIMAIAKEYGLYVVEDGCQAIGAEYTFKNGEKKQAMTMGEIGCTSFFPSKNLGCYGDGGALFTNDDTLAEQIRQIANHGCKVRYHHDVIGVNSRLDSIQAAILLAKLPHLKEYIAARQWAAEQYDKAFAECEKVLVPGRETQSTHVFHQYTLRINPTLAIPGEEGAKEMRDQLKEKLAEAGIPAMIYYPVPLHLQKAYADPRYKKGDFPAAEQLMDCVLSLPMHTELDEEQISYITKRVLDIVNTKA